jgi:hypothetical protein
VSICGVIVMVGSCIGSDIGEWCIIGLSTVEFATVGIVGVGIVIIGIVIIGVVSIGVQIIWVGTIFSTIGLTRTGGIVTSGTITSGMIVWGITTWGITDGVVIIWDTTDVLLCCVSLLPKISQRLTFGTDGVGIGFWSVLLISVLFWFVFWLVSVIVYLRSIKHTYNDDTCLVDICNFLSEYSLFDYWHFIFIIWDYSFIR